MKENKFSNKELIVVIAIFVICLGVMLYYFINSNKVSDLKIYKTPNGEIVDRYYDGSELAFSIKVSSKDAKILDIDKSGHGFILYNDDGLYIYDVNKKVTKKILLDNKYDEYDFVLNEEENEVIGITYYDREKNGFKFRYYNLLNNKIMFDDIENDSCSGGYSYRNLNDKLFSLYCGNDGSYYSYLYDIENGKVLLEEVSDKDLTFDIIGDKNKYIIHTIYINDSDQNRYYTKFFTMDYKLIYDASNDPIEENKVDFKQGFLYFYQNGIIKKYDANGNLLSNINKYNNAYAIENGYVVYLDGKNLILENIDNNKESKTITQMLDGWKFLSAAYFTKEEIDSHTNIDGEAGLRITIEYSAKDSDSNYGMMYIYNSNKEIVKEPLK